MAGAAGNLVCEQLGAPVLPPEGVRAKNAVRTVVARSHGAAFTQRLGEEVPCRWPRADRDEGHVGTSMTRTA